MAAPAALADRGADRRLHGRSCRAGQARADRRRLAADGLCPSKGLIEAAALAHRMRHADSVGLRAVKPEIDFLAVMDHVRGLRDALAPHDSPERLRRVCVDVIIAHSRFAGPRAHRR